MGDLIVFLEGALPADALQATYNPGLVALSCLVASMAACSARFGLRGMAERARALGARFEVGPAPGTGTLVRVTLRRQGSRQ